MSDMAHSLYEWDVAIEASIQAALAEDTPTLQALVTESHKEALFSMPTRLIVD